MATLIPLAVVALAGPAIIALVFYRKQKKLFLVTYLEGVYWDLDGTFANTELEAHLPAFNNAFNDLGIDWNWDTNTYIKLLKINGGKNRIAHYAKYNNDDFSEDLVLKIHKTKKFHFIEFIKKNCVSLKSGDFR